MPAARPTLKDQGHVVVLDVHGATVDEALQLIRGTLYLAQERGRGSVRVVHGGSTSDGAGLKRTIKNSVNHCLERGEWDHLISGYQSHYGSTTLYLMLGNNTDHRKIRLRDIF